MTKQTPINVQPSNDAIITIDKDKKAADGEDKKPDDAKKAETEKAPMVPFSQLFRFMDGLDVFLVFMGTSTSILLGAAMPCFSYVFAQLLDDLTGDPSKVSEQISFTSLLLTIIGLISWVLAAVATACFTITGDRQVQVMRTTFFTSILKQEVAFFDLSPSGGLASHLSADLKIVGLALGSKLSVFIQAIATFVLSYAFAFWQSWRLTLVMLSVVPVMIASGALMGVALGKVTEETQKVYATAGAVAEEVLSSIKTVQAFDGMAMECARYNKQIKIAEGMGIRKGWIIGLSIGSTMCILFGSYALAFWYGSYLIEWGYGDGGQVVGVFFAVLIGAFQLGTAAPIMTTIQEAQGAAHKVFAIINRDAAMSVDKDGPGQKLSNLKGDLEFKNVAFSYPSRSDVPIFGDFNLQVKPGSTVALVGPSGSGKSSLVSLLERFYDPDKGQVLVDGVSMTELNLHWWREQIGIVTQEPTLFTATVMENIQWANPDATKEQVIQACKDAFIHDVISKLPHGYDTNVGASGSQLSGGQKQRVAIARAIIKNPKILLLDEATSALDRQSEMIVQEALKNVMKGRTVVTIAHRLVTIKDADCICFIQPRDEAAPEGTPESFSRLLEQGTHAELMAANGEYAMLVKAQQQAAGETDTQPISVDKIKEEEPVIVKAEDKKDDTKDKEKEAEVSVPKGAAMKRTMRLNAPEWPWLVLGCIGAGISGCSYPVYSLLFADVLQDFYSPDMRERIGMSCLMFALLGLVNLFSNVLKVYCLNRAGEKLTTILRQDLFKALVYQDIGFYDQPGHEAGALCSRLSSDTTAIQHLWGGAIGTNVQAFICLAGGIVIAFFSSWKLTLVTISSVPAMIVAGVINTKVMYGMETSAGTSEEAAGQVASESIASARTVMAFSLQDAQVVRYNDLLLGPVKDSKKKGLLAGFFYGFSQFIIFGAFALSYWYGGVLVTAGELTFDGVIRCSIAVLMGAMGVGEVYSMAGDQAGAYKGAERVYEIIDRVSPIDCETLKGGVLDKVNGGGNFQGVQFAYPSRPDVPVLKGLDLDYLAGQRVAILGPTGCGKSTIISLLMRFYDPQAGQVCPEGKAMKELNLTQWRQHCGIVSQEPILFDDTVANNIKYGKQDATKEEIIEAAKQANIHNHIISLPEGYQTNVGAKGSQLSGGQKQRVAIARCIIRKPQVLLLDEATSALDNICEGEVQAALDGIVASSGMTLLTVAHRLSTIKNCNMIVVMDEGKVLEQGSHETLYSANGEYRRRYDQYYEINQ